MSVWPFDRTVLVRDAGIVAGRRHAVMRTQRLIALRQILRRIPLQIAERRREAVAAVLQRRATQGPQGVLQALGQGNEALAAQHHVDMLPAGERQAEVVEPMIERHAGDGDAKRRRIGEIRQSPADQADVPGGRSPPAPGRAAPATGGSGAPACGAEHRRTRVAALHLAAAR